MQARSRAREQRTLYQSGASAHFQRQSVTTTSNGLMPCTEHGGGNPLPPHCQDQTRGLLLISPTQRNLVYFIRLSPACRFRVVRTALLCVLVTSTDSRTTDYPKHQTIHTIHAHLCMHLYVHAWIHVVVGVYANDLNAFHLGVCLCAIGFFDCLFVFGVRCAL